MKAFLTGLGLGVGLGVLFAPDSGEKTRNKLQGRITERSAALSRKVERVKDVIEHWKGTFSEARSNDLEEISHNLSAESDQASEIPFGSADPINTLGREELLNVNGIGPVLADKIISNRPYSSRQELVQRGILPQSTFDQLERELSAQAERSA